jgi:hypothetical protein
MIFVLAIVASLVTTATVVADSLKFKMKMSGDQEVPPVGVVIDTRPISGARYMLWRFIAAERS